MILRYFIKNLFLAFLPLLRSATYLTVTSDLQTFAIEGFNLPVLSASKSRCDKEREPSDMQL